MVVGSWLYSTGLSGFCKLAVPSVGFIFYFVPNDLFNQILNRYDANNFLVFLYGDKMRAGRNEFAQHGVERRAAPYQAHGMERHVVNAVGLLVEVDIYEILHKEHAIALCLVAVENRDAAAANAFDFVDFLCR